MSVVEEPDEPDTVVAHVFIATVLPADLRRHDVWSKTASGEERLLLVGPDLEWLARPSEECVGIDAFSREPLEVLHRVEGEVRARWHIEAARPALLDLAQVAAHLENRRDAWSRVGVQVTTAPQYRTFPDGEYGRIDVVHTLPDDLTTTDWLLTELTSAHGEARLIVHDTGGCSLYYEPDDEDCDSLHEPRPRAGTLDIDGVKATFERVVALLTTTT